ncbi:MAG: hypothetical protein GY795_34035 [Desulfobacterales bacterium]|nr:hypothetical protein [Desulfobacterales bacterium]
MTDNEEKSNKKEPSYRGRIVDIVLTSYGIANSELLYRIRSRNRIILLYLFALGAVIGKIFYDEKFNSPADMYLLIAIPYIAFLCTFFVLYENVMISILLDFLNKKLLQDYLAEQIDTEDWQKLFFQTSKPFGDTTYNAFRFLSVSHLSILIVPSIIALVCSISNKPENFKYSDMFILVYILAWILFLLSAAHLAQEYYNRYKQLKRFRTTEHY